MMAMPNQTADIMTRFGFGSEESIQCMSLYFVKLNGLSSQNQPEGTLTQRNMQLSFDDVKGTLPMQLASRSLATYNMLAGKNCSDYVTMVANET